MTVADLWRQHDSRPRNQLVANAFFMIKYVEQFGTGIQRIVDDCHLHRKPEPVFEIHGQIDRRDGAREEILCQ
jgi:ATP-dependent DNA helicase RecG